MKFSRMEKITACPSQESSLGLQQTWLVLYRLSYRDQARNSTRTSDISTILLLLSQKERKILKDEVQQDGKIANPPPARNRTWDSLNLP